ncbi:MAG: hypothetical protein K0S16_129 [Moraxellaceae bacterium]|jgi:hypothetical protein|nr:hypothetical protein [Moraxellaceae bacterium]
MKRIARACALALLAGSMAAADAGQRKVAGKAKAGPAARTAAPSAQAQKDAAAVAALSGTAWRVTCSLCDRQLFSPYFLLLRADMQIGSNLAAPVAWDFRTAPGTWRVHNGELFIEWQQGSVQAYTLDTLDQERLTGLNQDNQQQVMSKVALPRPGPGRGAPAAPASSREADALLEGL